MTNSDSSLYDMLNGDYPVYLGDKDEHEIDNILQFCSDTGIGIISYNTVDVSDCSNQFDTITRFTFSSEKDALVFKLKYK